MFWGCSGDVPGMFWGCLETVWDVFGRSGEVFGCVRVLFWFVLDRLGSVLGTGVWGTIKNHYGRVRWLQIRRFCCQIRPVINLKRVGGMSWKAVNLPSTHF